MKDKKKKCYVLTVSKNFMKGHPRAGESTGFKEKILANEKIHTIRAGDHWYKVVQAVNSGAAYLSVREWSGKPYASPQVEICKFMKLGYQIINIDSRGMILDIHIDGKKLSPVSSLYTIAANDGLTRDDFNAWFNIAYTYPHPNGQIGSYHKPRVFEGAIIHFTDLVY